MRAAVRSLVPGWLSWRAATGFAVAFAVVYAAPLVLGFSPHTHNLLALAFMYVAAASAWNWVGGYVGQVSFGHAAMFGIGGFVSARALLYLGAPFGVAWLVGGLSAGLYALLWGHPTLRLRGPYFAIATIGVGEATRLVATFWEGFTGGSSGLSLVGVVPPKYAMYWYGLFLMAATVAGSYALSRSRTGAALRAIRADPEAAEDVGVNVTLWQDVMLLLSGAVVGVCGAFYASYFAFIEPGDLFDFDKSISLILMSVVGGIGTVLGPVLGAGVFVVIQEMLLASYPELYLGLYGLLLVAVILFQPLGITGLAGAVAGRLTGGRRAARRPATAGVAGASGPGRGPVEDRPVVRRGGGQRNVILRVEGLSKHFGGLKAVDGVDLHLEEGEILGLIGPNGAGKTTLFGCIAGSLPATGGRVVLDGRDITGWPAHRVVRAGICRTHQIVRPFGSLSLFDNVLVAAVHGSTVAERTRRGRTPEELAGEWLEFVGLGGEAGRLPGELTLVDRKRLETARALATMPRILLLDEVIAGLNPAEAARLVELIREIRDRGVSIVMIEHVMKAVMSVSDRIVVLDRGRKIAEGAPSRVAEDPHVVEAYLGEEASALRAGPTREPSRPGPGDLAGEVTRPARSGPGGDRA